MMFLDTSGLLALANQHEEHHHAARVFYGVATSRVTHNYVLAEFVPLCLSRGLSRTTALSFSRELLENAEVSVLWVNANLHEAALEFLEVRRDKTYSLCDAVSFLFMKEYGLTEALTTDHHFEQAGFRRLLG
jgi:predicted nucleic acid-binding protein